tara:strand:+ start:368 stop:616 length:249 start_codon:yes stop_codon:yes gene_type:complete
MVMIVYAVLVSPTICDSYKGPWSNAELLDLAMKRDIVAFLQENLSVEDLRRYKLLGKLGPISKKSSKGLLKEIYIKNFIRSL